MVSLPSLMRAKDKRVASSGDMMLISKPSVSCSGRYCCTFAMICASWARLLSNQNTAGVLLKRARRTASLTQSRIGASLTWHILQISPASTLWLINTLPLASTTLTTPSAGISKVLSWLPYSSAFCAIKPTFGTLPMVLGSKAPCSLQKAIVSW